MRLYTPVMYSAADSLCCYPAVVVAAAAVLLCAAVLRHLVPDYSISFLDGLMHLVDETKIYWNTPGQCRRIYAAKPPL